MVAILSKGIRILIRVPFVFLRLTTNSLIIKYWISKLYTQKKVSTFDIHRLGAQRHDPENSQIHSAELTVKSRDLVYVLAKENFKIDVLGG